MTIDVIFEALVGPEVAPATDVPSNGVAPARPVPAAALDDYGVAEREAAAGDAEPAPNESAGIAAGPRGQLRSSAEIAPPDEVDAYQVDRLLRRGQLLVVAAAEGIGKTQAEIELAIRAATGTGAFLGHYAVLRPLTVALFDEDNGDAELWRREEMVLSALGLERSALERLYRVSFAGLSLARPDARAWLERELERIRPDLTIFDTGSAIVGDEWGAELKDAMRFLRSLTVRFGVAIVITVHLTKPARDGKSRSGPHGSSISDVMGQWTRQADVVATMSDLGAGRARWTLRKRVPPSSLVIAQRAGLWEVVAVEASETGAPTSNDDRILQAIAAGATEADQIRTALGTVERPMPKRTFYDALARLRQAGYVADRVPLSLTDDGLEAVG